MHLFFKHLNKNCHECLYTCAYASTKDAVVSETHHRTRPLSDGRNIQNIVSLERLLL